MIKTIDTHESNTANIPPPKTPVSILRLPSRQPSSSGISETARYANHQNQPDSISFPAGWGVPLNPGLCLTKALESQWHVYRKQLRQCQKHFSVKSVHELRVATRRLITHYCLIERTAPGQKVARARKKLKRRLKLLGQLRDAQVQRAFIEQQSKKFPFLEVVRDFLRQREKELVKRVAQRVRGLKSRKLGRWTSDLLQKLRSWPADEMNRELITTDVLNAAATSFNEVINCRIAIDPADSQTIHRTRVAFKKFRYMVEALSPAFTGLRRRELRRLANYQRRMGNLQDLEIIQACILRFLQEHPDTEDLLAPFSRYLRLRRRRAIRLCLQHADDLFQFHHADELCRSAA